MTQVVGRPTPRVEGQLKVTGKAVYSADVELPGTLWGKCLRSPISYGRIKSIDTSKARQVPGVKAVITGQDVPGLRIGRCIYDTPVVADGLVRLMGRAQKTGNSSCFQLQIRPCRARRNGSASDAQNPARALSPVRLARKALRSYIFARVMAM